jgi:uncharacterized phage infection (PIP) family protein YhgE
VGTDWNWTPGQKAVSMTEDQAKMLVNNIVEAVTNARQTDLLDHFQKLAQVQVELNQARNDLQRTLEDARKEIERRDNEIRALREHIDKLMNMLNSASSSIQFSPYNNNGSQTYPTTPVPMPPSVPSAPPYQGYQYQPLPTYEVVPPESKGL